MEVAEQIERAIHHAIRAGACWRAARIENDPVWEETGESFSRRGNAELRKFAKSRQPAPGSAGPCR